MKSITVTLAMAVLALVLVSPVSTFSAQQYVQITEPFVNVYEFLDPKSPVVAMVKKNDRLELILAGSKWYQVKVRNSQGWIERKAGRVVEGAPLLSTILMIAGALIVIVGSLFGVSYFTKKQTKE